MSGVDTQLNEHNFFNDPSLNYPTIILLIFFALFFFSKRKIVNFFSSRR